MRSGLTQAPLPRAYFSGGDANEQCTIIHATDAKGGDGSKLEFCEDAVFWDVKTEQDGDVTGRQVLVSCDPGRKSWNTVMGPLRDPNPHGALWVVDYEGGAPNAKKVEFVGYPVGKDFHPLGIDISVSIAGNSSNVFVVNHGRYNTTIEQFTMHPSSPTKATYVRTISHKYFVAPNSIALTSPTSFFVTNDHILTRRLPGVLGHTLPLIETFFAIPLAFLGHVSIANDAGPGEAIIEHTFSKLGIPFANGVATSPDGKQVAVASSSLARVHIYKRTHDANGKQHLELTQYVPVPFAPDNLLYDDDGNLLVAGHPRFQSLGAVARNKTAPGVGSPSWLVKLVPRDAGEPLMTEYDLRAPYPASKRARAVVGHEVETIYQSDGLSPGGFSSSTTGLWDTKTGIVFISGLYAEGVLMCKP